MMLLEADGLDTYYGPSQVLHGCGLDVREGECVALLGRNGVGKSTLVHTLAGLIPAKAGVVRLDGVQITGWAPEKRLAAGMTLVPQGHRVFKSLTVEENLEVAERGTRERGAWAMPDVLERFPILAERSAQPAGSLSGGQQQMLAVARALLGNGRLVLMDEPSEGLDPQRVARIGAIVRELKERGTSILLVEQRVSFALSVADRVAFMVRGEVVEVLDAKAVRDDPSSVTFHLGLVAS
jgi:branched-chain amino acid transport system ATP-binding protein